MTTVMRDHPGWTNVAGAWLRAVSIPGQEPFVQGGEGSDAPETMVLPAPVPSSVPAVLERALRSMGPVRRWRNPSLWDAVATAIIRQVISADQARAQHRRLRQAFGPAAETPHGPVHALPCPQTVMDLDADELAAIGMAFKTVPLRNAADAYLLHGAKWAELPPEKLVQELQTVPRIGPWTAGAAAADFTHDWALYPYSDLAVRKWARTASPEVDWPTNEKEFAARWHHIAGKHLGSLTLFTLAWGVQHGGSP